ncbi:hypothetical protein [Streptomyces sp. NPDC001833]|uniref:hypothetical protein n=1 Tax=Streptomyces sp. NPDC001833 TaxID=3154658 RepID=UPI0033188D8A
MIEEMSTSSTTGRFTCAGITGAAEPAPRASTSAVALTKSGLDGFRGTPIDSFILLTPLI